MDIYKILRFLGKLSGFIVDGDPKSWGLARLLGLTPQKKK